MPVRINRVYTRVGDTGTTALGDGSRVPKTDPRLGAYADVDETNSVVGVAIALGGLTDELADVLRAVQNDLFDVGADLCAPVVPDPEYPPLRITEPYIERLEGWCDEFNGRLGKLTSFILPGAPRVRRCCTRPARWPGGRNAPAGRWSRRTASAPTSWP